MTEDRGGGAARAGWRVPVSLVLFSGLVLLWLMMIEGSTAALFFEPTTEALARAAHAWPTAIGAAVAAVIVTGLLAITGRRFELLLLGVPATVVILGRTLVPDGATAVAALLSTLVAVAGCLVVLLLRKRRPGVPWTVAAAARLGRLYALVLSTLVGLLAFEQFTGAGQLGAEHLSGLSLRGLVLFSALLMVAAVLLWQGAITLLDGGGRRLILIPLCVFLVLGIIGELSGVLGSASLRSDLTGLAILATAGLPVVFLAGRQAREWSTTRPDPGRRHRPGPGR